MANTDTIDIILEAITPKEWGDKAFVYSRDNNSFCVCREKDEDLEKTSPRKFEAKALAKDGKVIITLPADFARFYLWNREARPYSVVIGGVLRAMVFVAKPVEKKVLK